WTLGPQATPQDLQDLDKRERAEGDEDGLEPVEGRERLRLEHAVQEGDIDDDRLQRHRPEDRQDELRVREQADLPDRLSRGPDGEDQEQFEEHDRGEGDGPRSDRIRTLIEL